MYQNFRVGALLLMGGLGRRFGSEIPKQFHSLAGKPVFIHTLHAFLSMEIFDEIILSCHRDWMEFVKKLLPKSDCEIRIVEGGETRQESSRLGLLGFQKAPDIVCIHDAVRPFVTQKIIHQNVEKASTIGAVDTCIASMDTLVYAPSSDLIDSIPVRSQYLRGQTPQTFSYPLILRAHAETMCRDSSDDCQLVLDLGHPIGVVIGDEGNIKITSGLDLFFAEQLIRQKISPVSKSPLKELRGKRVAIIGGSGGIGNQIIHEIQKYGGNAIALSRNSKPISLDLKDPISIQKAFEQIKQDGPIDGLINCGGCLQVSTLEDLTIDQIHQALDVNLKGLIFACKMAPLKEGGHVINIASSSFSRGRKDMTVYSAAKAGVVNFTQGWAEERPDLHIHVVIPQRTNTSMRWSNFPKEDPSSLLDPQKVAETVIELLLQDNCTGLLVEVRK